MLKPQDLQAFIPEPIQKLTPLTSNHGSKVYNIQTAQQRYVYKTQAAVPDDLFLSEQQNLQRLQLTGKFLTPTVTHADAQGMVLQYVDNNKEQNWPRFAEQLAQLHKTTQTHYGLEYQNYFAGIEQNNTLQSNWCEFYREQRLRPLLHHPALQADDLLKFDLLFEKLDQHLDNSEPPALIHGDLWQANIIFNTAGIYLIDPACYYASREIELAYLEFVGDARVQLLQAYHASYPISPDYYARKPFYLLYPHLLHLHLLGESYLPGLRDLLKYLVG
jgi:fructosamine-3-kinase